MVCIAVVGHRKEEADNGTAESSLFIICINRAGNRHMIANGMNTGDKMNVGRMITGSLELRKNSILVVETNKTMQLFEMCTRLRIRMNHYLWYREESRVNYMIAKNKNKLISFRARGWLTIDKRKREE